MVLDELAECPVAFLGHSAEGGRITVCFTRDSSAATETTEKGNVPGSGLSEFGAKRRGMLLEGEPFC